MVGRRALRLSLIAATAIGCRGPAEEPDRLASLRDFESTETAHHDFSLSAPPEHGPDPYRIEPLEGALWAGILRGSSALVLLDDRLTEIDRTPAPLGTTALSVDGAIAFVAGELSPEIVTFEVEARRWRERARIRVRGAAGIRALAHDASRIYALDENRGQLVSIDREAPNEQRVLPAGARPFEIRRVGDYLLTLALLDHTLSIHELDGAGWPLPASAHIRHAGPIWSFDARVEGDGLAVAAGGVEDRPLDRTIGSFGYVDSFVFTYRWRAGGLAERTAVVNVSEHGVVTPKALRWAAASNAIDVWSYGGNRRARIEGTRVTAYAAAPGVSDVAARGEQVVAANPLLDTWMLGDEPIVVPGRDARTTDARVGEALFYTYLMAPANRSDGPLSRFTCETCHFEGSVDGRVHHSGRGDVRVSTKPLLGLFGNRPYFTRALDPSLTVMVDSEFRVAGAGSGTDPWFSIAAADHPWLAVLGVGKHETLGPEALRRALIRHLMSARHRQNPATLGRTRFSPLERRGAGLFQQRCASCHAARFITELPESAVPFDQWEAAIFERGGPIVWASSGYQKTGIEPYVHERGARTSSLRRLYLKRPYFTNGSAASLDAVLERVRFGAAELLHHAPERRDLRALSEREREALRAFLELL